MHIAKNRKNFFFNSFTIPSVFDDYTAAAAAEANTTTISTHTGTTFIFLFHL